MSTQPNPHRYCVIMSGGIGSRFWPYSRQELPKQFLDFLGTGRSLLQLTYDRVAPLISPDNVFVATNRKYRDMVLEQLPGLKPDNVLCEPARRNTAPCVAWAAWHIHALDPEASIVMTPSDHLVMREAEFRDSLSRGFDFVEGRRALLTLGIRPTRPETGYGYIQVDPPEVTPAIHRVKTFTEKPDAQLAQVFVDSGEFLWNSGIFIWTAQSIMEALRACAPDLASVFDSAPAGVFGSPRERAFIDAHFPSCPSISIDYAVMEKADDVYVETVGFSWSDLGTWGSLYDNSPKNRQANVTQRCRVLAYDATGNIFASRDTDKLVVVKGIHDCIIADTPDVLLICPKSAEQSVRQIVDDVKQKYGEKYV